MEKIKKNIIDIKDYFTINIYNKDKHQKNVMNIHILYFLFHICVFYPKDFYLCSEAILKD